MKPFQRSAGNFKTLTLQGYLDFSCVIQDKGLVGKKVSLEF